jgi:hypothetical protein
MQAAHSMAIAYLKQIDRSGAAFGSGEIASVRKGAALR